MIQNIIHFNAQISLLSMYFAIILAISLISVKSDIFLNILVGYSCHFSSFIYPFSNVQTLSFIYSINTLLSSTIPFS